MTLWNLACEIFPCVFPCPDMFTYLGQANIHLHTQFPIIPHSWMTHRTGIFIFTYTMYQTNIQWEWLWIAAARWLCLPANMNLWLSSWSLKHPTWWVCMCTYPQASAEADQQLICKDDNTSLGYYVGLLLLWWRCCQQSENLHLLRLSVMHGRVLLHLSMGPA